MDIRKVKKLIELLEESVRISRQPTGAIASHFPIYAPPPAPAALALARLPEPPPPPAPQASTITKLAPAGLVHVPEEVNS